MLKILVLFVLAAVLAPAHTVSAAGEMLSLSVSQGSVGRAVTVSGSSYTAPDDGTRGVVLMFGKYPGAIGGAVNYSTNIYKELIIVPLNLNGTFSSTFSVPSALESGDVDENVAAGTYYVYATYYYSGQISPKGLIILQVVPFTVVVSSISVSPNNGTVGTSVAFGGTNFGASEALTVKYDGVQITLGGTTSADINGQIIGATVTIPPSAAGAHTILVTGQTSGATAQASFTVKPMLSIEPTTGAPGTVVTASGTGFGSQQSIAMAFGDVGLSAASADVAGTFSASFPVPAKPAGSYLVKATDTASNTNGTLFEVTPSGVTISPTNGNPGTQVTVSGTGFARSRPISIAFNNVSIAEAISDADGKFSATFSVPEAAGGTYKVKATDGFAANEVNFIILLDIDISPVTSSSAPAHIGQEINITGSGGTPGTPVVVAYNGVQVVTATVEDDRGFDATFAVPKSSAGQQTVIVSVGGSSAQFTVFIESTLPALPNPLKPEPEKKAKQEAAFDWSGVTDPSGVTYTLQIATDEGFSVSSILLEKTGLTDSEYTLTEEEALEKTEKDTSYYWRVRGVDGAGNQSPWSAPAPFYVGGGFSFSMSQTFIYVLFSIGALGLGALGFWLGRKTSYY